MLKKTNLSIVIPVHNEEENVVRLYEELMNIIPALGLTYEIIFIDDGSTDNTFKRLKDVKADHLRIVQFQRNYGKAAALSCGFREARGKYIITMDGDLQDDPKEIPKFLMSLKKYDMVSGWKFKRKDAMSKRVFSKIFNNITRILTGINIHDFNCGYKGYRSYVVKNIHVYAELHRYVPVLAYWKGYTVGEIKVDHHERIYGKSKYGIERVLKGFLDLITVIFLVTYKKRPLHIFGSMGFLLGLSGILICAYVFSLWFRGIKIGDRPLLMLGILLIVTGVQFISLGLIGELVTNTRNNDDYIIKYDSFKPETNL
ncbi:MAG: undecaprenyl phosphate 4-deoxy-4-formamido-L-arabinose transferase [Methanomethylovorans sp. PtaU1.Bin073]|nr:MAG: undecaprenyl phosphate 4-deoxy-4-formamido-L-arabinose transferase [Methanomethylovorans sp. PtaU1.Bin073]